MLVVPEEERGWLLFGLKVDGDGAEAVVDSGSGVGRGQLHGGRQWLISTLCNTWSHFATDGHTWQNLVTFFNSWSHMATYLH